MASRWFSRAEVWARVVGTPAPVLSAGTAERQRLCLKVGFPGPPLPPSWARTLSALGMGCFHNRGNATVAPKAP